MEVTTTTLKPTPIPADDSDIYDTSAVDSNEKKANTNVNVISEVDSGDGLDQGTIQKMTSDDAQKLTLEQPANSDPDAEASSQPVLPKLLVPSLKGKMSYQGGIVTCKGLWGMSDEAHEQPGQTSDFEFKLIEAVESSDRLFPINGKYQGWFFMKQAPPAKGMKVEDKDMMITFSEVDSAATIKEYRIEGNGLNKFGKFNLRGTLMEDGNLHIYREYYALTPAPASLSRRKSTGQTPRAAGMARRTSFSGPGVSSTDSADGSAQPLISPRESGRVRKQSFAMQEYQESKTPRSSSGASSSGISNAKQAEKQPSLVRQESSGSERTQRLTGPLKKCYDLVRELCKHPQGVWFLDPVDYVALNLPDYPKVVKKPMDFATIRSKIESGKYDGPDDFADDMRLVFRNAMQFNFQVDSAVHIAAKEMLRRFEDKYRVLTTQLGVGTTDVDAPLPKMARTSSMASVSSSGTGAGRGGGSKRSSKGGRGSMSRNSSIGFIAPAAGPRPGFPAPPVPVLSSASAGIDASAHTIAEMQRMMQAMQEEINMLRTTVKQQEIVTRLSETKDAAQHPLTHQEKKELIDQIHELPLHKMESVIKIIQSSLGVQAVTDEIPLDTLDTLTMRKLQKFIDDNNEMKRRTSKSGGVKRPRKPKSGASSEAGLGSPNSSVMESNPSLYQHEDEELLFPMESLEDTNGVNDDQPVTMDDEDDFAALASPGRK